MKNYKRKNIRIRLYRMQDYDLYRMYYDPDFNLQDAFRDVVSAYANGEPPPIINIEHLKPLENGSPVRISISFTIWGEREIQMLEAATKNSRNANNFCKALLRRSIVGLNAIYFDDDDMNRYRDTNPKDWTDRPTFASRNNPQGRTAVRPFEGFGVERNYSDFQRTNDITYKKTQNKKIKEENRNVKTGQNIVSVPAIDYGIPVQNNKNEEINGNVEGFDLMAAIGAMIPA